ncbi:DUF5959 family protein [Streptomyces sp. UH6]|uniref:DUF5959 family protein n=1 Tax=Streptomyces sp. UH6 TaxID=2748379 RepID=UPI0015D470CB|nr:DUF5959 family protein [Streptomyces sp. UH6]NYV73861.1 hypothetical protein [Streptomyces sp. UH6]
MGTDATTDAVELIRLTDPSQGVSVRLRSTTPSLQSQGIRYYDAEVTVTSGFVNGSVHLGFDSEDLAHLRELLNLLEDSADQFTPDDPFMADWPHEGETAYLRLIGEDPYVIEVHDGTSSQIVVSVPVDLNENWVQEAKERLAAACAVLGEPQH